MACTTIRIAERAATRETGASTQSFSRSLQWLRGRHWWREVLIVGSLYVLYELARGLVSADFDVVLDNGFQLLRWEDVLHLDPEHALNNALVHLTPLAVLCSYYYAALHYVVTPVVLVWMYRRHAADYGWARNWIIASTVLGLIGYITVPTAPPRLLPGSGFHDTLAAVHQYGWWGSEASVPRGFGGLADSFAAMPSLHVGWALWVGVLLWRFARRGWVRVLGVLYPVATTFVVMATGNHYLFDALAGAATMGVGAVLARGVLSIRNHLVMTRMLKA
ncbi:MAG TPA: phosphatase PAP2 family protein [Jatrophihabitans sp.]|jgi:hypothetical protein